MPNLEDPDEIPQSASPGVDHKVPHLKCFHTDAHSMRSKHQLGALAQSQRFDISGLTQRWLDEFCAWRVLLDGCAFRTDLPQCGHCWSVEIQGCSAAAGASVAVANHNG